MPITVKYFQRCSELVNARNRPASQRHPTLARARIQNVIVPFYNREVKSVIRR